MFYEFEKMNIKKNCRTLFFFVAGMALLSATVFAQSTSSTPKPNSDEVTYDGYKITSSIELGYRGTSYEGNRNKFRSDFNYRNGFRLFDSSFRMENTKSTNRVLDRLLVTTSGWGADRSGFTRINAEGTGLYTLNANFRRISYFNSLTNHALNEHNFNTNRDLGDVDLTVTPIGDKLKLNFGASFEKMSGPGNWTSRAYRDDFMVDVNNKTNANDIRFGADTSVAGFDLSLLFGKRNYNDKSRHFLTSPTAGNNTTNTTIITAFDKSFPTEGDTQFATFNMHRTFGKWADFTGRYIYSIAKSKFTYNEIIRGRDQNNDVVDSDVFDILGSSSRPAQRVDLGFTIFAADKLKISETFTFDRFSHSGGENLTETVVRLCARVGCVPNTLTRSTAYRTYRFEKYINTIEADYQFNNRFSFHIGYRYGHRKNDVGGYSQTLTTAGSFPTPIAEEEENSTNAVIAGGKFKPTKWWVMFWDVERGTADNVFSRLENYEYTNLRFRNRMTFDRFGFNFSVVTKDNNNPSESLDVPPRGFGSDTNSRIYSASLDYRPTDMVNFDAGYTYTHVSSSTVVSIFAPSPTRLYGDSQYYIRDNTLYASIFAKANKYFSLYGGFNYTKDHGQDNRLSTRVQDIISSYPMKFMSPEIRLTFRLSRNVDWNVGYQYMDYDDEFAPSQNYKTHLPYTSLRIYFGGADR